MVYTELTYMLSIKTKHGLIPDVTKQTIELEYFYCIAYHSNTASYQQ